MVGRTYPSEKTCFTDPTTGARITQYTQVGTINRTLYFTNRPYVCDGEHLVFLSNRTGRNEMFLLHLRSGKITQVTDLDGQANVSNCLHPSRPELYVRTVSSVHRIYLDTLKTEELLRAPKGFRLGMLNLNSPPWLAFEMMEEAPHGPTPVQQLPPNATGCGDPAFREQSFLRTFREQFFLRRLVMIYRYNVDTDEVDCVWSEHRALSHVQISPTNPQLMIWSDWSGYGLDRVWYIDLSRRIKAPPRPLLPESSTARGSHECFTRKGNLYLQWMEGALDHDSDHTLYHGFHAIGDVPAAQLEAARTTKFRRFRVPERMKDLMHHFTMSLEETWGVHDRWLGHVDYNTNLDWLSIFRHQDQEPQTIVQPICFHNGARGDEKMLGAELTLDDRDERATYTSFLGGTSQLCQVDVRPFVEKLMSSRQGGSGFKAAAASPHEAKMAGILGSWRNYSHADGRERPLVERTQRS